MGADVAKLQRPRLNKRKKKMVGHNLVNILEIRINNQMF